MVKIILLIIISFLQAETYYVDINSSCPAPDGSLECPYLKIQEALDNVQQGDIVIIKEGDYFEHVKFSGIATSEQPIIIEAYPGEKVVINGTLPITQDWEPYDNNGHVIYKTQLDTATISLEMGESFKTVYQLFINNRMMIPSQIINYKNPTDPTTGTPDFPERGTVWDGKPDELNQTKLLIDVDSPEEWSYNDSTGHLFIYTYDGLPPNEDNVRIRVLDRVLTSGNLATYPNGIPYGIDGGEYITFKGIEFYAGAVGLFGTHNFTFEDCKFFFSTDNGGFNSNTPGLIHPTSMNQFLNGSSARVINCEFKYINDYPLNIFDCDSSLVENCLFEYNDWTNGTHQWLYTGISQYCTVRYVTIQNSMSPGIFTGIRSLVEYCLIRNLYEGPTYDGESGNMLDGASIQRNSSSTYFSTTRYCWIIHGGNINGFRFDSNPGGVHGKIHHMVSIRNRRGFRLKGDRHQVHHLLAYDNQTKDISLPNYKYTNDEGNFNTDFTNSAAEEMYECAAPNCNRLGIGWSHYNNELRDMAGLWEGPGNAEYVLEMENDAKQDWGKPQLELAGHYSRYYNIDKQSYDFRPRKGSRFIDTGMIVDSINDGIDYNYPHTVSFPNQNRRFIGNAPDIGPYEYADSLYWIPGYRYSYPTFPIPSNGANNVPPDYSLVFNYPYKKDYANTQAVVTVNGPGVNRIVTLNYPNNVVFQDFHPSGIYNWQVTVDGISSENWLFQVDDKLFPIQDRSIDVTLNESTEWLQDQVLTIHGAEQYIPEGKELFVPQTNEQKAFLMFDVPEIFNDSWDINLNLTVAELNVQGGYGTAWQVAWGGVVLYSYNNTEWSERNDETNIGIVDHTLSTPIDTLTNLEPGETYSINLSSIIQGSGKYSFALAAMEPSSRVLFWSKERNLGGIKLFEPVDDELLPHLSFESLGTILEIIEGDAIPKVFHLYQNYPNPFNPVTSLRYDLPEDGLVNITIYDMMGRVVKTLVNDSQTAGYKSIRWNATNDRNEPVSAGLYLYTIQAGDFRQTKKMVLLK